MTKIRSLYYHNPTPEMFEKMVKHHKRYGYTFISIRKLYEILTQQKPVKGKFVFISFDDGWQGNLQLLPIIEKYNVPICVFVSTEPLVSGNFWWEYVSKELDYNELQLFKKLPYKDFYNQLEGYKESHQLSRSAMTVEDLTNISKHPLISIQSHTVNHPILTSLPENILENELANSKNGLETLTGQPIFAFSYPNGSLSEREIKAVKRHYSIAFTTEQKNISLTDDIYTLPRYALTGQFYRDLLKVLGIWMPIKGIFLCFRNLVPHLIRPK